jgi:hypothetical protein
VRAAGGRADQGGERLGPDGEPGGVVREDRGERLVGGVTT